MTGLADLLAYRVFPVVTIRDARRARGLAAALAAGGLPVAEITLRTPAALDAITEMAASGEVLVGAGTVLPGQVDAAVAAGARFVVSPGLSASVVRDARRLGVPVLPGVVTPTEVLAALDLGLEVLKFFPAEQHGGVDTLRALAAPFGGVGFVPTGGITAANLGRYLGLACVRAVAGSWMVPPDRIDAGDFPTITTLTRDAVAASRP